MRLFWFSFSGKNKYPISLFKYIFPHSLGYSENTVRTLNENFPKLKDHDLEEIIQVRPLSEEADIKYIRVVEDVWSRGGFFSFFEK